jgi:hypothetical protein
MHLKHITPIAEEKPCDNIVGAPKPSIAGAARFSCVHCRGDAWLAPSGQRRVKRFPSTKVICSECFVRLLLKYPDTTLLVADSRTMEGDLNG